MVHITFPPDSLQWDVQIRDADKKTIDFYGIDFTQCSTKGGTITLTLNADGMSGTAAPRWY